MAPGIQGRAWSSSGTSARTSRSQRMKWHLQLGLAALTGLLILGMLWLRQHEIEMARSGSSNPSYGIRPGSGRSRLKKWRGADARGENASDRNARRLEGVAR